MMTNATNALDLKQRILEAARRQPSPTRRAVSGRTAIFLVSAMLVTVATFFAVGAVREAPRPLILIAGTALGTLALALGALFVAFGRGRSMLGRPRAHLIGIALAAPAALFAWKYLLSAQFAEMTREWPARPGLRCFGLMLAFAALPLVALAFSRRNSDPTHPRALGAALGVAAGMCAAFFVDLWCPVAYPLHLVMGHLLPIALLGGVGVVIGARVLALRGR